MLCGLGMTASKVEPTGHLAHNGIAGLVKRTTRCAAELFQSSIDSQNHERMLDGDLAAICLSARSGMVSRPDRWQSGTSREFSSMSCPQRAKRHCEVTARRVSLSCFSTAAAKIKGRTMIAQIFSVNIFDSSDPALGG